MSHEPWAPQVELACASRALAYRLGLTAHGSRLMVPLAALTWLVAQAVRTIESAYQHDAVPVETLQRVGAPRSSRGHTGPVL
jgi:hypothetical protein